MTTIQFFPLDIQYRIFNNKPIIYIYGRAVDGQQVCVIDENFEPYFYAIVESDDIKAVTKAIMNVAVDHKQGVAKPVRAEEHDKKLLGKEVKALRIYTQMPWQVPVLAKDDYDPKGHRLLQAWYKHTMAIVWRMLLACDGFFNQVCAMEFYW